MVVIRLEAKHGDFTLEVKASNVDKVISLYQDFVMKINKIKGIKREVK